MSEIDQLPRLVGMRQAAAFLGVSYYVMRGMVHDGVVETVQVKRNLLIPREELRRLAKMAA